MKRKTLTSNEWIEAAFRALTAGGPQAIRAEAIARELKVSKGSFYWHFKNVDALKVQMLQRWKDEATENIIEALEGNNLPPADKLRALVEVATAHDSARYGGILAEAAIRDWGRYDARAAETVKAVDIKRLVYLDSLFEQCGAKPPMVRTNSSILYGALIGMEPLFYNGLIDAPGDMKCLLEKLLESHSARIPS